MSEVEDDQFKRSNRHYSAFFITTENNMGKASEKNGVIRSGLQTQL